jgi:hypothetical protein
MDLTKKVKTSLVSTMRKTTVMKKMPQGILARAVKMMKSLVVRMTIRIIAKKTTMNMARKTAQSMARKMATIARIKMRGMPTKMGGSVRETNEIIELIR